MLRAMDSAVAGLRAHQSRLDVIGHNIANVNTYGYKSQSYSFSEAMYQTSSSSTSGSQTAGGVNAAQYGYGSLTGSISMDMGASTPTYVGGFNATISGEGFFVTSASNALQPTSANIKGLGDIQYSRVGQFLIDSNGYMVDSSGNFIYGYQLKKDADVTNPKPTDYDPAAPLTPLKVPASIDPNTNQATYTGADGTILVLNDIKINALGEVTGTVKSVFENGKDITSEIQGDKVITHENVGKVITLGIVAIATFQNPEGLTKQGGYYYGATNSDNTGSASIGKPGDPGTAPLMAGYLEASNVDLAKEFSDMITTQRGFQANTKMITVSDEVLNELVNMKR